MTEKTIVSQCCGALVTGVPANTKEPPIEQCPLCLNDCELREIKKAKDEVRKIPVFIPAKARA